jgi:hypothetical protein
MNRRTLGVSYAIVTMASVAAIWVSGSCWQTENATLLVLAAFVLILSRMAFVSRALWQDPCPSAAANAAGRRGLSR